MKCDRFWTFTNIKESVRRKARAPFVICWTRISRERLIFNKGRLFLNKGGLLENKRGLLGEVWRRKKCYIEILIIDFTLKR